MKGDTNNTNGFQTPMISILDVVYCSHITTNPGSAEHIRLGRLAHCYFTVYLHLFPCLLYSGSIDILTLILSYIVLHYLIIFPLLHLRLSNRALYTGQLIYFG